MSLATERRILSGSPLAYGEGNVSVRIKNILNYKKPVFWVTLVAVIIAAIVGIGLLSDPNGINPDGISDNSDETIKQIQIEITQTGSQTLTGKVVTIICMRYLARPLMR